jgi:hypothetical protein
LLAVEFGLILLGVVWIRSLEQRLMEAGLPRWSFWPYFLAVFCVCFGTHVLKVANGPETLALFLLLQLPALLFQRQPTPAELLLPSARLFEATSASHPGRPARRVTPIGGFEFAVYILLLAGLWHVLHLLRGDMTGIAHARILRFALDAGSALLCLPWFFSVRGRLNSLGLMRWTISFCSVILAASLLPFALRMIDFPLALLLFVVFQVPAAVIQKKIIPARFSPNNLDC